MDREELRQKVYIPDVVPDSDLQMLQKYARGHLESRYGFGEKLGIVVVDMTRAFVEDQYTSGCARTGEPCARAIRRLLDVARPVGIPIYYTKPSRWSNPTERGRWSKGEARRAEVKPLPPEAYEIVDILAPQPGEIVVEKAKPSAFFGTQFNSLLVYDHVDTLIVTGMVTSGCIRGTVNDSFSNNYITIVPHECVADRSDISHEIELFDMGAKYADVISVEEVIAHIQTMDKTPYQAPVAVKRA